VGDDVDGAARVVEGHGAGGYPGTRTIPDPDFAHTCWEAAAGRLRLHRVCRRASLTVHSQWRTPRVRLSTARASAVSSRLPGSSDLSELFVPGGRPQRPLHWRKEPAP
jgi:hypothetical protein